MAPAFIPWTRDGFKPPQGCPAFPDCRGASCNFMTVAEAIRQMLEAGLTVDQALTSADLMERALRGAGGVI